MTALFWMLAWLLQVLPAMSELPQPFNVTLNSSHFIHILKWEPGPGTPTGVYYQVTVITEMGSYWVPVIGCELVQHPLVCNLTKAFPDPNQVYFTKIKALPEAQGSKPVILPGFKPIKDTQLDLPLLTVTPCGEDLCVDLQPPMEHLREIYDSMNYKLRIKSNNADKPQFKDTNSLRRKILKDLASGRQYCVSVCFSEGLVSRESNYSQPVCASTPGQYTADPWISATLCLLVMFGVVVGALLFYTGFICRITRPLPWVLTSIHHIEEVLVIPSRNTSSSLLNVEPTLPSSDEKKNNQTSDESDGETITESTGGSRGGDYKMLLGNNLLSSSSSSSSSLSVSMSPEPELLISTDTHSNAGLNEAQSTHTASRSDSLPMSDTLSGTEGRILPNQEEKKVLEECVNQDVNLHTLTFGMLGQEVEEVETSHIYLGEMESESCSASEECSTIPTLPPQTSDTKEVIIESVSCSVDEEEEEEHCGYMGRPSTDVLQNLL
ncbi:interferon alpha/beta receptor 2-like [Anoplopoma fimbria]|uniref:interferon alpha/beta receptor 2-like n=1 Tax=Anoplopoma fimbria TaxID=229290 RepID=UPI0023EB5CDA|nr:interferon alpha/beta receptor 2-like [Anoplopoma fimbria]